jgi:preprotein translocase SecE subunit
MGRFRKWIDLALVLSGLALWFLSRQMFEQVWEIFRLPLYEGWPLQLPSLAALVLSLTFFVSIRRNKKAMTFLDEVANELAKVTWPAGKDTVASTGVIIVMLGIAALILFGFDTLWGTLTRSFLTL